MKVYFISATTPAPKSYRRQHHRRLFGYEEEILTGLICSHSLFGRSIGTGLAEDRTKSF